MLALCCFLHTALCCPSEGCSSLQGCCLRLLSGLLLQLIRNCWCVLQNVANLALGVWLPVPPHPQLFAALSSVARAAHLEGYSNQNVTDLAWGCAATGFKVV